MLSFKDNRFLGDFTGQLTKSHHGAGKGNTAYKGGKKGNKGNKSRHFRMLMILGPGKKQTGDTTEAVKQSNHLRHRGHLDFDCRNDPNNRTNNHPENNPFIIKPLGHHCNDNSYKHAHSREQITPPGRCRRTEHFQPQNKQCP